MKLINSSYKIVEQQPGINGIYQAIESAGRTCYKSSDKITETSAKDFVDRMVKSGHGAMLEFGTVYLKCPVTYYSVAYTEEPQEDNPLGKYDCESHSRFVICNEVIKKNCGTLWQNFFLFHFHHLRNHCHCHLLKEILDSVIVVFKVNKFL